MGRPQILYQDVLVTLNPGASVAIPISLGDPFCAFAPQQVYPDRATAIRCTAATTTTASFTNPGVAPESVTFRCQLFHSIETSPPTIGQLLWQGLGGSVGGAEDLQAAYNAGTDGVIKTDAVRDGVFVQYTAGILNETPFAVQNAAGTINIFAVRGDFGGSLLLQLGTSGRQFPINDGLTGGGAPTVIFGSQGIAAVTLTGYATTIVSESGGDGTAGIRGGDAGEIRVLGGDGGADNGAGGGFGGSVEIRGGLGTGGAFGGGGPIVVAAGNGSAGSVGGDTTIFSGYGGNGVAATPGGAAGVINVTAGNGGAGVAAAIGGVGGNVAIGAGFGGADGGSGAGAGGSITMVAGTTGFSGAGAFGAGGTVTITGGFGAGGGDILVNGGFSSSPGSNGGRIILTSGQGGDAVAAFVAGDAGLLTLLAGNGGAGTGAAAAGDGGVATLRAGSAGADAGGGGGNGGNVLITAGNATGAGNDGIVEITTDSLPRVQVSADAEAAGETAFYVSVNGVLKKVHAGTIAAITAAAGLALWTSP